MTPPGSPRAAADASGERPAAGTRTTLADRVYARLKDELHDFLLMAGDRFNEIETAQRLGVSRTPLREALFRLRNEGFLEVESKAGWSVRQIDFDKLDELYDLRVVLELASVERLCALAGAPPELIALREFWMVGPTERARDPLVVGQADEAFHSALVMAAGNREISRVHREVTERIRIVRRLDFTHAERIEATYDEHSAILQAIGSREVHLAGQRLRQHIEHSRQAVHRITLHALQAARSRQARCMG